MIQPYYAAFLRAGNPDVAGHEYIAWISRQWSAFAESRGIQRPYPPHGEAFEAWLWEQYPAADAVKRKPTVKAKNGTAKTVLLHQ